MTNTRATNQDLFWRASEIWRTRGLPLDSMASTIFELIAVRKLSLRDPEVAAVFDAGELTASHWQGLREMLWQKVPTVGAAHATHDQIPPGLIEELRQLLESIAPMLLPGASTALASDLIQSTSAVLDWRRGPVVLAPPAPVFKLMARLIASGDGEEVYIPGDASGWLPIHVAQMGCKVAGEVQNTTLGYLLQLVAYIGDLDVDVRTGDMLRSPSWMENGKLRVFSASASCLSFGRREKDEPTYDSLDRFPTRLVFGEGRELAHLIAQTNGKIAVIASEGLLFRTTGGEREFKEWLVRKGYLRGVIRLPRNTFAPASMLQSSLIVLDTRSSAEGTVTFVDATSDLDRRRLEKSATDADLGVEQVLALFNGRVRCPEVATVDIATIEAQDFNLTVDRYLAGDADQAVEALFSSRPSAGLEDIAEIIRPQSTGGSSEGAGNRWGEVALGDIRSDGTVSLPKKTVEVDDQTLGRVKRQALQNGDVLLSIKGRIGTTALIGAIEDERDGWIASQAFLVLRVRKTSPITPRALARFLGSALGYEQLRRLTSGTTVPSISMNDLRKVRVLIPSEDESREVEAMAARSERIHTKIDELKQELDEIDRDAWPVSLAGFLAGAGGKT